MAEWFKALVLKTRGCQSSVGSNPTSSATNKDNVMQKKITDMTTDEILSLLMYFTETACNAMANHKGYQAGLNIRYAYETLKICKVQPMIVNDVDMEDEDIYIGDTE